MLIAFQKLDLEAGATSSCPPCEDKAIRLVRYGILPVLKFLCLGSVIEGLSTGSNALRHSSLLINQQHHLQLGTVFLCIKAFEFLLEGLTGFLGLFELLRSSLLALLFIIQIPTQLVNLHL
jgi:hypothetical protein